MSQLLEHWMDRYRGTPGLLGRIVFRLDVLWLKNLVQVAKRISEQEQSRDATHEQR